MTLKIQQSTESALDNAQIHDALENIPSNLSSNTPFADIVKTSLSRRTMVTGSLSAAIISFLVPTAHARRKHSRNARKKLVGFQPVTLDDVVDTTMPTISKDYVYQVLAPWGTPVEPDVTAEYEGDPGTRPTPAEASLQIGLGHDGMWFFPMDTQDAVWFKRYPQCSDTGMLCINHEFGTNNHALGKSQPESLEDVRLSQNVHGVSVIKIKQSLSKNSSVLEWKIMSSTHSRRITVNTPVAFSGPAAKSKLLQNPNGNIPLGTVNNCGSGPTPWGTYLTCEENFNGYFGASVGEKFVPTEEQDRYGLTSSGFGYGWHQFDKRFDLSDPEYANEHNRFGWVVEIDPFDGAKKPVKRTALGRFKHEAIAIAESKEGRIAAYMGDDQRFDYCYKYVSDKPWRMAIEDGESPLDHGRLYAAKFDDDNSGEWLELTIDNPVLAARFSSQADIMIYARLAADLLGATPMDRPEWTTIGKKGEIFWTCTNNHQRTEPNAANPEAPNNDGHIIRMKDQRDHLGTQFNWDIYMLASSTLGTEEAFTDPDVAWADPYGRLFVGTDGTQPDDLQDQLVVFDVTRRGRRNPAPKRLLVGVNGDEITGFAVTPDQRTAFVNVQHPGNGSAEKTNFPATFDGITIPRDCTLVITRKDGGIIGS